MKLSIPFKLYPAAVGAFLTAAWAVGYMLWRVYVDKHGAIDQTAITSLIVAAYQAFIVHPLVTPTARPRLSKAVPLVELGPAVTVVGAVGGTGSSNLAGGGGGGGASRAFGSSGGVVGSPGGSGGGGGGA